MVILSRIYTRTGDKGSTALGDFSRTSKTDPRLAAYADTDEANSTIGVAIACGDLTDDVRRTLVRVQNDLFDVGADLCTPLVANPEYPPLRVQQEWIDQLEADIDRFNDDLEKLRSFILPGGTPGAAHLHVARTVVRRAERSTWEAIETYGTDEAPAAARKGAQKDAEPVDEPSAGQSAHGDQAEQSDAARPGGINPLTAAYLNRLSDLLFVLARVANVEAGGDVLWVPGGER
ncbi:cob(I)yrinic acid a,c-diamide adenosyltransferase [Calidifontibacter indicus]|uniref:cob(I)yrinic acid a,c-diamide adenosyltransferase n=1 Tax=Calidifontibacter indicus TaxID=419650 RepID=UPI003D730AE4